MKLTQKNVIVDEPIAIALSDAIKGASIPQQLLISLIELKIQEVEVSQLQTLEQFINRHERAEMYIYLLFFCILNSRPQGDKDNDFFDFLMYASRGRGIVEQIKLIRLYLPQYKINLPAELCKEKNVRIKGLWDRRYGVPSGELNDAVLELSKKDSNGSPKLFERSQEKI